MNHILFFRRAIFKPSILKHLFLAPLAILSIIAWPACNSGTLKTIDLTPTDFKTGADPFGVAFGVCLSGGTVPQSTFSPGKDEILVGFDDFFKPGADPFPCNHARDTTFRAGVLFDLSQFDSIVGANFLFDTDSSIERSHGETTSQSPPKSFATTLGLGTHPFTPAFPDDDEVTLPAGPNFNLDVSGQVRDWITKSRPNNGFVIAGPRQPATPNSFPQDNDAKVSFYSHFKLRIIYNPAQNPHAPQ